MLINHFSNDFWRKKVCEPKKRLVGGSYGWACHRFPIKGGISYRDIILIEACRPNPLLKLVQIK